MHRRCRSWRRSFRGKLPTGRTRPTNIGRKFEGQPIVEPGPPRRIIEKLDAKANFSSVMTESVGC